VKGISNNRNKNFIKTYAKSRFMGRRMKQFLKQVRIKRSRGHELKRVSFYGYRYRKRYRKFVIWRRKFKGKRRELREKRKLKAKKNTQK